MYDAMFIRATRLPFGDSATAPLSTAYAELRAAAATIAGGRDVDTLAEVLWALHGLATLARNDRLRPRHDTDRIDLLVDQFRADRGAATTGEPGTC